MVDVADALLGVVLDSRYRLTSVLRTGTTANSYLASRVVDGSPLVVKVLATHDPTEKELQRLRTEAAIGARLSHPAIATPIAVLRTRDGAPFLVYEPPRGEELSQRLKRNGKLSIDEAREFVAQAGDALAAAHKSGVVHGDLRPGSFYVDGDGRSLRVQLIDFGIARLRESRVRTGPSESTNTPAIIGAVSYMSPEQALGTASDVASDQFSFAVVIYEALTGKQPFGTGSSIAILSRVMHAQPPPAVGIPRDLEKVILRGLAKKPRDRFPSVTAFCEAFASAVGAASPTLPPAGIRPPPPSRRETVLQYGGVRIAPVPRRKRPTAKWVAAGCALAAALGSGILLGRHWSSPPTIVAVPIPVVESAAPPKADSPDPNTVGLQIEVQPVTARVRINDRQVSPPSVRVPRATDPLSIVVDAEGYLPKTIELVPDGDQRLVVHLVSTAAPTLADPPRPPPAFRPRPVSDHPTPVQRPPEGHISDLRDPFAD
jgi:serine/threonine-protein kinase